MVVWKCEKCGYTKDSRCKPKKCPECQKTEFSKAQEKGCGEGCGE